MITNPKALFDDLVARGRELYALVPSPVAKSNSDADVVFYAVLLVFSLLCYFAIQSTLPPPPPKKGAQCCTLNKEQLEKTGEKEEKPAVTEAEEADSTPSSSKKPNRQ